MTGAGDAAPRTAVAPALPPMLAKRVDALPSGEGWWYEPKWDGFRSIVFFDGERILLQSRDLKPLDRYFPELVAGLRETLPGPAVLDGEVVIAGPDGLDFGALQQRIHPAASRVRMLAEQTPASFVAFDALAIGDEALLATPMEERRRRLERALEGRRAPLFLTPGTTDEAMGQSWFERFEGAGLDGVIAKRLEGAYEPGVRSWLKIKHIREADCVVAGLRWAKGSEGTAIGSLLLGLYDDAGDLHYVGHTSSFKTPERRALAERLRPLFSEDESDGFGQGRTPGGQSRWTGARDTSWQRVRPELVCEVSFDHLQGARFRHASTFRRWRPDKPPRECTFEQLATVVPIELARVFEAGSTRSAR